MMKFILLAFIAIVGLTQSQRTPKRPPPPPGFRDAGKNLNPRRRVSSIQPLSPFLTESGKVQLRTQNLKIWFVHIAASFHIKF